MKREKIDEAAVELARETLLGDARDIALNWIKQAVIWQAWSEKEQQKIIDSVTDGATKLVERMAQIMATDGRDSISVVVDSIKVKDGMVVTLKCAATEDNLLAIALSGGDIHLVRKSKASYEGTRGAVHPDPDEPPLPFKPTKDDDSPNGGVPVAT